MKKAVKFDWAWFDDHKRIWLVYAKGRKTPMSIPEEAIEVFQKTQAAMTSQPDQNTEEMVPTVIADAPNCLH
jgi:hypothetical protein